MAVTQDYAELGTGLAGLDGVLKGLMPGDNVVWQLDAIKDYSLFTVPYAEYAERTGRRMVYFRFARHEPLFGEGEGVEILRLQPEGGFERFIAQIHQTIEDFGGDTFYVFDCLSDLAVDWCSDRMLGNFFVLICPYVFDMQSVAYFSVLRNHHSFHALSPITSTAQIFIDVYRHKEKIYIQPGKVQHRYSRTMYTLHGWEGDEFRPVADSATITEILAEVPWSNLDTATIDRGYWSSSFTQAREILAQLKRGQPVEDQAAESFERLVRMAITHDPQVIQMAEEYLGLEDMVNVRKRMIGTGHLGGKAVGLLLARAILEKKDKKWGERLEPHDSFYVGSDVYYSFLVNNGVWWLRSKQTDPNMFLRGAADARHRILNGSFPDYIQTQFSDMLDHFGQSPIIVRSSSLLEDSFGATFAGKGKSVMCANQGPRRQRLEDLMAAVRTVYASTMSESALNYRARRGILDRDEQMALLIQRVSGSVHGHLFFPTIAGVGFSFNPYVWSEYIDAKAGMLRLVCGLGTRAVERSDEDYTRIVALNEPQRRPETSLGEVRQYSQRNIDVIDLDGNRQVSYDFKQVAECDPGLALNGLLRAIEK